MKAYEFPVKMSEEGKLEIPAPVSESIPPGKIVRVILLVPESEDLYEQMQWDYLTAKEFFAGYSESDSIYDEPE